MPRISQKLRKRVTEAAHAQCEYCRTWQELTLASFHLDHIIPQAEGGAQPFFRISV